MNKIITFYSSLILAFNLSLFSFAFAFNSSNSYYVLAICLYLILGFMGSPPGLVDLPFNVFPNSPIMIIIFIL